MANLVDPEPVGFLLSDVEVQEFRALVHQHANAELTVDEARSVSGQLLRVLAIVRDLASGSNDSASSVDEPVLPESAD
jgi:hypothetical protein